MRDETPKGELILYQTEDGRTRIECRFENDTLWLTQALMAELFDKDVRTDQRAPREPSRKRRAAPEPTIRRFRIVRTEGNRWVPEIEHYNLKPGRHPRPQASAPKFRRWADAC